MLYHAEPRPLGLSRFVAAVRRLWYALRYRDRAMHLNLTEQELLSWLRRHE